MDTRKCPIDVRDTAIEPRSEIDFDIGVVRNLGHSLLSNGVQGHVRSCGVQTSKVHRGCC